MVTSRESAFVEGLVLVAFAALVEPATAWVLALTAAAALSLPAETVRRRLAPAVAAATLLTALSGDALPLGVLGALLLAGATREASSTRTRKYAGFWRASHSPATHRVSGDGH